MPSVSPQFPPVETAPDRSDFGVPPAAVRMLDRAGANAVVETASDIRVRESAELTLLTIRCTNAAALDPAAFEACTRDAYTRIANRLRTSAAPHPVRFWNYIPDIHRPSGENLDRYMCFNAGRFAACSDWLGGPDTFDRLLATGSGVGHSGSDLVVHALASNTPGVAVENPRQTPAYRYSRRFGPRPPCFARATILRQTGQPSLVLVGGTASIRGEESVHVGDLRGQLLETFENLASLISSASDDARKGLEAYRELRVYHFREADRETIAELVDRAFPQLDNVEFLRADLCRPELAVEIEGIAQFDDAR